MKIIKQLNEIYQYIYWLILTYLKWSGYSKRFNSSCLRHCIYFELTVIKKKKSITKTNINLKIFVINNKFQMIVLN